MPKRKSPQARAAASSIRVGSLFAAIGGFTRAFHEVGATPVWANEKDKFAGRTYTLNFPKVRFIHKPVEQLTVAGDALEPVDVLTAGFPCQPFSVAGRKEGFSDERGSLFLEIIRIIKEFGSSKPKVLLLENVKHFRKHDDGRTFARVKAEIQRAGYWFADSNAVVLNTATHTTIPQNRERLFMVALSTSHFPSNNFQFPAEVRPASVKSVRSFLDLKHKAAEKLYFRPGDRYYEHFRAAIAAGDPKAVYLLRRNYVRQNMSGHCFTLMANMGDGGHNHPVIKDRWGIRKLTSRECARLQGYTDRWFKIPSEDDVSWYQFSKQIGNSVTVPLVRRIAKQIVADLVSVRAQPTPDDEYRLDLRNNRGRT